MWLIYKLLRPILPISSAVGAWHFAVSCGASQSSAFAAALAIALSAVAASLYHYGGQSAMYARKSDRVNLCDPQMLDTVNSMAPVNS